MNHNTYYSKNTFSQHHSLKDNLEVEYRNIDSDLIAEKRKICYKIT